MSLRVSWTDSAIDVLDSIVQKMVPTGEILLCLGNRLSFRSSLLPVGGETTEGWEGEGLHPHPNPLPSREREFGHPSLALPSDSEERGSVHDRDERERRKLTQPSPLKGEGVWHDSQRA